MSTTFDVYPKSPVIPTFKQILELSTLRLKEFLLSYKIKFDSHIDVVLRSKEPDKELPTATDSPAMWADENYTWFFIQTFVGGTDAYFWAVDDALKEECQEQIKNNEKAIAYEKLFLSCVEAGHYWHFRRSAGQPAIINIAYGLIASSLAEITEGVISTYDGAWDYQRFPATAEEFYSWYFRPEKAISENHREWSAECLKSIPSDLGKISKGSIF